MVIGLGAMGGNSINIVISAVDNFSRKFAGINTQLALSKKHFQSTYGELTSVARTTGLALTGLGIVGGLVMKGMVDEAMSFESAFIGVRKTVELTEEEFGRLENRFKSISGEIPVTFQELAGIGEIAGQLGVEGVENLEKFTRTVADISATTNLTAEGAATDFARLANVMQEPLDNIDKMGSVVVELGNNFATTEGEILSFATRIAGVSNIVGLTTADTLAIGAAFTSVGVQAEAGGTAFQKTMLTMNEAVIKGGAKLDAFAGTAGMSSEEFQTLFAEDASKAFELFVLGLGKQGDNAITTLETLDLTDVRLTRSMLSLANAGDLVTRVFKKSDKEWKKNTALTKEAEKRYKSMESQVKILSNKFKILIADLGEELFPVIEDIIDVVGDLVDWFSNLDDGTKKWIIRIGAGATAFALLAGPILLLLSLVPSIVAGFALIGGSMTVVAGQATTAQLATKGLNIALWKLAGLGLITAGVSLGFSAMNEENAGKAIFKIVSSAITLGLGAGLVTKSPGIGLVVAGVALLIEFDLRFQIFEKASDRIQDFFTTTEDRFRAWRQGGFSLKEMFFGPDDDGYVFEERFTSSLSAAEKASLNAFENIRKDIDRTNSSTNELGSMIGSPVKGSYPLVYSLLLVEAEWENMKNISISAIQAIIMELNKIPREIVTIHRINTIGGNSGNLFGNIPFFQEGGVMPHTGLAYLHEGETITPAGEAGMGVSIHIENVYGTDPDEIAEALQDKLNTLISN